MKYVLKWDLGRWLPSLGVVDFPRKVPPVQLYYINEWRQLVGKQVWSLHLHSTSKCYQGPQQNLLFSETLVNSHLLYFCKTIKVKDSASPSADNLLMFWYEGIFWAEFEEHITHCTSPPLYSDQSHSGTKFMLLKDFLVFQTPLMTLCTLSTISKLCRT